MAPEHTNDAAFQRMLHTLPSICSRNGQLIKSDDRGQVYRVMHNGHSLAVKRFPPLGVPPGRILRRLRKKRWGTSLWRRARNAYDCGLSIAEPLGLYQPTVWYQEAYLVLEWIDGRALSKVLGDQNLPDNSRALVAEAVGALIGFMHGAGISHGDLKARNILVRGFQPVLIDPDGLRIHRVAAGLRRRKHRDWKTLMDSLDGVAVDADYRERIVMGSNARAPHRAH